MAKIKFVKADVIPVCPSCKKDLPVINQVSKGILEYKYVFTCPHCRVILGIGSSKVG